MKTRIQNNKTTTCHSAVLVYRNICEGRERNPESLKTTTCHSSVGWNPE
ncbi:hypothetical protein [uncultured Aquimarina sp.]|nr:hypothetical protein [uncultured Aquimarina sp.]